MPGRPGPVPWAGYQQLPSKLPGNRGFDGVFVRRGTAGAIDDLVVVESKFAASGRASLPMTKTMGRQMSDQWIDSTVQRMLRAEDRSLRQTGRMLFDNQASIRRKANVLDATGVNRWNRLRIRD